MREGCAIVEGVHPVSGHEAKPLSISGHDLERDDSRESPLDRDDHAIDARLGTGTRQQHEEADEQ